MPCFNVFFEGEAISHAYFAASPDEARKAAHREDGRPIRKIKLDRETVDPSLRAPRLTRRELRKEPTMSLAEQVMSANARFVAAKAALALPPKSRREPALVTEPSDVARKMAAHMLDIAAVKGSVEEDDLLTRGWTLQAIREHGTAARDLANVAREREG